MGKKLPDAVPACAECGMIVDVNEYHPFAACLMFKACKNGETVRANMKAVIDHGSSKAVILNGYQLHALAEFIAPDKGDTDQLETDTAIVQFKKEATCDETGEKRPPGYYAWIAEYPEEGSIFLDPKPPAAA